MKVDGIEEAVRSGLLATHKTLPSWLLYDAAGSAIYEEITQLPEYYLTRAEDAIFAQHGDAIVRQAADGRRISIAEIGAGSATKTERLLEAAVRLQGSCVFLACDISESALQEVARRIPARLPSVDVRVACGSHRAAGPAIAALAHRQVLLFIGSSIGNYTDEAAISLLSDMRVFLRDDAALVLGTDLRKDPDVLRAAYNDSQGVTARFTTNLLVRMNRELDADFNVDEFRHIAEWDDAASNIEVYLESLRAQSVRIGALGATITFAAGERIHTETSAKYDLARADRILAASGFSRVQTHADSGGRFGVHVARCSA